MGIFLKTEKVKKEWTDYNGHMNVAYYTQIYDTSSEIFLKKFKMDESASKIEKRTTFSVEAYTIYNQEVKFGDEIDVKLLFLDRDKKRLLYKLAIFNRKEKYLSSTSEILNLYVDLKSRKVAEFEDGKKKIMDDYIRNNSSKFDTEKLILINKLKKI